MKKSAPLLLLAATVLLSACSTTKDLFRLEQESALNIRTVKEIRLKEEKRPDKAVKEYGEFLARQSEFSEPIDFYRKLLNDELQALQTSPKVLSDDSLFGFSCFYHARLQAVIDAHLGLARGRMAKGELEAAEKSARQTADISAKRAASVRFAKRNAARAYALLEEIHGKQGLKGKVLLDKLDRQMAEDYLRSEQGVKDAYLERESCQQAHDEAMKLDNLLTDINMQRMNAAGSKLMSAVSTVSQGISSFQKLESSLSMGSRMNLAGIVQTAANLSTAMSAPDAPAGSGTEPALGSLAGSAMLLHLIDPKMGVNPHGILREFARSASELSPDESLRKTAQSVSQLAETAGSLRGKVTAGKALEGLASFGSAFSELRSQLESLRTKE